MIIMWHSDLHAINGLESVLPDCDIPYHTNKSKVHPADDVEVLQNYALQCTSGMSANPSLFLPSCMTWDIVNKKKTLNKTAKANVWIVKDGLSNCQIWYFIRKWRKWIFIDVLVFLRKIRIARCFIFLCLIA